MLPTWLFLVLSCSWTGSTKPVDEVDCVDTGCENQLDLELTHEWTPGLYRFDVVYDGKRASCEGSVPGSGVASYGGLALKRAVDTTGNGGFERLRIEDVAPTTVELTISRDGTVVYQRSLSPTYAEMRDDACEPCRHGAVPVVF